VFQYVLTFVENNLIFFTLCFSGTSDSFKFDQIGISIAERLLSGWCTGEIDLPFGFQLTVLIGMCHAENKERQQKLITALKTNRSFLLHAKNYEIVFHGIHDIVQNHFERIELFGRFPERNKILKRYSTEEEIAFLNGLSGGF
jgi:uncharacterized protein (DUF924 family)